MTFNQFWLKIIHNLIHYYQSCNAISRTRLTPMHPHGGPAETKNATIWLTLKQTFLRKNSKQKVGMFSSKKGRRSYHAMRVSKNTKLMQKHDQINRQEQQLDLDRIAYIRFVRLKGLNFTFAYFCPVHVTICWQKLKN